MAVRIIISDEFGQHGLDIKTAISNGYGSDISSQIEIIGGWSAAYNAARTSPDVIALIRSTTGVFAYVGAAQNIYPRVQTFFPLGSNSFINIGQGDTEPPVIVTSGAGDDELRNNTGYGNGLEFWDQDLTFTGGTDASSFSNGYVLGKLLKIKDTLNCSWWEARYRARMTTPKTESNRLTTPWDIYNGYGKIDVSAAIAFSGAIITDPYISTNPYDQQLGNIGTISHVQNGNLVQINMQTVVNAYIYELQVSIDGFSFETIQVGQLQQFIRDSNFITLYFRYRVYNNKYTSNYSSVYQINIPQVIPSVPVQNPVVTVINYKTTPKIKMQGFVCERLESRRIMNYRIKEVNGQMYEMFLTKDGQPFKLSDNQLLYVRIN